MSLDAACTPCCCDLTEPDCCFPDATASLSVAIHVRESITIDGLPIFEYETDCTYTSLMSRVSAQFGYSMIPTSTTYDIISLTRQHAYDTFSYQGNNCPWSPEASVCPTCMSRYLWIERASTGSGTAEGGGISCVPFCGHHRFLLSIPSFPVDTVVKESIPDPATGLFPSGKYNIYTVSETVRIGEVGYASRWEGGVGGRGCLDGQTFRTVYAGVQYYSTPESCDRTFVAQSPFGSSAFGTRWLITQCGGIDPLCVAVNPCDVIGIDGLGAPPDTTSVNFTTCPFPVCVTEFQCTFLDCDLGQITTQDCGCAGSFYPTGEAYPGNNGSGVGFISHSLSRSIGVSYVGLT